jgi:PAS domain S-box-containing protein
LLIVDDSADDAELVRRALTRGGLRCVVTRVDDAVTFSRAIAEGSWDLVIADYSQPSFGALAVLELLRAADSDLPCVVISGVAGEDRAVQTMRAGAKDFVNKDRMHRLVPAVMRELAERAQRVERERIRLEELERDRRLRDAGTALLELLRGSDFASGNTNAVFRALTELVARTLDVDRVSIWMFDDSRSGFACMESFERGARGHDAGQWYRIAEHPAYFEALERSRFVEAHDLNAEPPRSEGARALRGAQLDAAIRIRGAMAGALCLDHLGSDRRWRSDEMMFVGSIADLIALVLETDERRRAEQALVESEARYREVWENALDAMVTIAPDGRITSVNNACCTLLGLDARDITGRWYTDFVADKDVPATTARVEGLLGNEEVTGPLPFHVLRGDRKVVYVEASAQRIERNGRVVELLAIVRDVSQRRALESQLQQSQKMEAIGRLAGGVAHDFNNLLTAIIGYSQIAAIRPDVPAAALTDLREITSAAQRAAALTRQLLAFSRQQVMEPRVVSLNTVVSGIEALLRRLIGEDLQLETDLQARLAPVLADPSQLEQVILNLAVNARDAMPNGGRIVLRTRSATALDPTALAASNPAGPYAVLEVSDSGTGMDEETRQRIFEPFFTTKAVGTGLGLSTVYGIVQQSGGAISVESEPGSGTVFRVFLPVVSGTAETPATHHAAIGPRGHETILVVEDDDRVRALASRVLRLAGYSVLEASTPEGALATAASAERVDLVLTDLVMPQMRGDELYRRLRVARPRLRVLFMSGYRDHDEREGTRAEAFLAKPFTPDTLTTAVRRVLDATPVGARS